MNTFGTAHEARQNNRLLHRYRFNQKAENAVAEVEFSEEAMDLLKADYFRPEMPSFEASYNRVQAVAERNGWILPSLNTAKAMIKAQVSKAHWERKMFQVRLNRQLKQVHTAVEREPQTSEVMASQQYLQLQKLQQMANDLLAAIDEAFPYKTKEAIPIARHKQFLSLPKAQADSVARLRSEVAFVAKNGFVERGLLGLTKIR